MTINTFRRGPVVVATDPLRVFVRFEKDGKVYRAHFGPREVWARHWAERIILNDLPSLFAPEPDSIEEEP